MVNVSPYREKFWITDRRFEGSGARDRVRPPCKAVLSDEMRAQRVSGDRAAHDA